MKHKYKITFNAPVILGFVIICFVVMVVDEMTDGESTRLFFMTYHSSLTSFMTSDIVLLDTQLHQPMRLRQEKIITFIM